MMKFYYFTSAAVFAWLTLAFYGCDVRPERKKLPEFSGLQGWEDMPLAKSEKPPFLIGDTTINDGNKLASFLSFTMTDPMYDSVTMHMIKSYEPFTGLLFERWAKQQKKGILIDLRLLPDSDPRRADFSLKKNTTEYSPIKVPLIIIWDRASEYRFDYLLNALRTMPEIKCNLISESRQTEGIGRTDCFSRIEPEFE
jgi:hypothetical protein